MRLYRKGKPVDMGSGWFPTISEAMEFEKRGKENKIISIMWIQRDNFKEHFESNGIGYRAINPVHYAKANPITETMTLDKFEEILEHPIISRYYHDGEY